jgi:hypothetical protein
MTDFPISGGCICGSVRYTVNGPPNCIVHCHCSQCRKSYASLVGTAATVAHDQVRIDKGEQNLATYVMPPRVRRQFCKSCGCTLFYFDDNYPEVTYYYPATLDDGAHPGHSAGSEHHVFVGSKVAWENFQDDLPRHDGNIPESEYTGQKT